MKIVSSILALLCAATATQAQAHPFFQVKLDNSFTTPVSGRLLLFAAPATADTSAVDMNQMTPTAYT